MLENWVGGAFAFAGTHLPVADPAPGQARRGGHRPCRPRSTAATRCSPRSVGSSSPRWSTRSRASTPPRPCRGCSRSPLDHPVAFPIEVRFASADEPLLSTSHGRDTAYIAVHQDTQLTGSPTSERSRRSWTHTGVARIGASATSRPPKRWHRAIPAGMTSPPSVTASTRRRFANAYTDRVLALRKACCA